MKKTNIIIIIIILILGIIYFVSKSASDKQDVVVEPVIQTEVPTEPELTQDQARELVVEKWGDCGQDTCGQLLVTTEEKDDGLYVVAIYDKLYDDSVAAERRVAKVEYIDGVWVLGDSSMTHSCQKGRGHQDFSNELCI